MDKKRWNRIEFLCLEASGMSPEERLEFLEAACLDDRELIGEVESLLSGQDIRQDYLGKPFVTLSYDEVFSIPMDDEARTIGPYRIIRLLARGGMGEVYLASREEESYNRFAALKVIQKGLDSDTFLSHFNTERQILANLNHPHIARLYEGGTTDDGLPWFSMEYVEGKPVTEYCNRHSCTIEEKLSLFVDICSAVQHAHQNLVVHRDLKPGNILITDSGIVKLLDFGIAKLLDHTIHNVALESRQPMLTPEYAAPEQFKNKPVTTATDIYSLGVLLYELLTGHLPYKWESKDPALIESAVCDQPPVKPNLNGDLDAILLKALQKVPHKRFMTVEQFSDDIQRHLRHMPVIARPPAMSYRIGKFVKRHKAGVAIASAFMALILSFGIITFFQSAAIKAGAAETEKERERLEKVSLFLIDLFKSSDPSEAADASITARELLLRGSLRIESELQQQPGLQSDLFMVISDVYKNMGLFSKAEELAWKAYRLREDVYGYRHADVAQSLNALGLLHFHKGEYDLAESRLLESLHLYDDIKGRHTIESARTLNDLAILKQALGDYSAADSLLTLALDIRRGNAGYSEEAVGVTLSNYAALKWRLGDLESAEAIMYEVLDNLIKNLGEDDLRVAIALTNLGAILLSKGDHDAAEPLYRRALDIRIQLVGDDHPDVAQNLAHLGNLMRLQGHFEESEYMLLRALDIRMKHPGPENILVGDSYRLLGQLYTNRADYQSAVSYYSRAENVFRGALPPGHSRLGDLLHLMGGLYLEKDNPHDALEHLREALNIRINHFGLDDKRTAETMLRLGICYFELEKHDEAKKVLLSGLDVLSTDPSHSFELVADAQDVLSGLMN